LFIECIIEFEGVEVRPSRCGFFPVLAELWIVNMPNLKKGWKGRGLQGVASVNSSPFLLGNLGFPNLLSISLLLSLEN